MRRNRRQRERFSGKVKIRDFTWEELQSEVTAYDAAHPDDSGNSWHNGPASALVKRMREGDAKLAEQAEQQFDVALEAVLPETVGGAGDRISSPIGAYPNVPAFLAGHPGSMYRRAESPELGPVRLFVDNTTTCTVAADTLLARGVAVAALAYAIQTTRPVELWILVATQKGNGDILVAKHRVGIAPLDMSRVAIAVSDIGLARRMYTMHGETHTGDYHTDRPYHRAYYRHPDQPGREILDLGSSDVFIQPIHTSQEDAVRRDPMGWLLAGCRDQLADANRHWQTDGV